MKNHVMVAGQYTYTLQTCLGKGAWGAVFKAKNKKGEMVALKKMNKFQIESSAESYEKLESEILALQQLKDSEYIIKFIDVFRTEGNYYIITEYVEGSEDLLKFMQTKAKRFTEMEVKGLWRQLLEGVQFLHDRKIIHRDLKLQNILYLQKSNQLKIIDFGLAVTLESKQLAGTQVGSPMFMSPQVINGIQYSNKCDIWSLGIVFYYMLFGQSPYGTMNSVKSIQHAMQKVQKYGFELQNELLMSEDSIDLIKKCLMYDQSDRPTAKELLDMPFFKADSKYLQIIQTIGPYRCFMKPLNRQFKEIHKF